MSAQFLNFKLKPLSKALAVFLLFLPAMMFTQSSIAQNVSVFKCEKNGVTVYQSMKEGTDKTCTKFEVYIDPNVGASASAPSNISRASISRTPDLNSVASQVQKNRDLKRMELLANELTQEEEALKGLMNKASVVSDERELKKINEQKTITINNINAIKKELGPNANQALQMSSKNNDLAAFNLNQVAPSFAAPTSMPTLPPPSVPTLEVRLEPRLIPTHTATLDKGNTPTPISTNTNVNANVKGQSNNSKIKTEIKSSEPDLDPMALVKKFMSSNK